MPFVQIIIINFTQTNECPGYGFTSPHESREGIFVPAQNRYGLKKKRSMLFLFIDDIPFPADLSVYIEAKHKKYHNVISEAMFTFSLTMNC